MLGHYAHPWLSVQSWNLIGVAGKSVFALEIGATAKHKGGKLCSQKSKILRPERPCLNT